MSEYAVVIWHDHFGNYTQTVGIFIQEEDHVVIHNDMRIAVDEVEKNPPFEEHNVDTILLIPNSMVLDVTKLFERNLRVVED